MERLQELERKLLMIQMMRGIHIKKALQGVPICKGQHPILDYVYHHEGCSQKQIAEHLMVTPASIALSVKRMAKAGLIRKDSDENNLRCNRVYLTELGRNMTEHATKFLRSLDQTCFEGFSEEELTQFIAFTDRVMENLKIGNDQMDFYSLSACLQNKDQEEIQGGDSFQ